MAKAPVSAPIGKEIGRKLSIKEMGYEKGDILALVVADQTSKHFLARFIGVVHGLRPYKIKEGDRTGEVAYGLQGEFKGISANGEEKEAATLYLPGYVNDGISAIFANDATVSGVRIAYDIYASFDKEAATSYVFSVHDLLNTGSDTVAEVQEEIKALPLPGAPIPLALPKE